MKPAQFKAVKAILKASYGIEDYQISEESKERIIVTPKNTEAFHATHIVASIEALGISSYLSYNVEVASVELRIF